MMQTLQQSYTSTGFAREAKRTIIHQFVDWCEKQEKNRLLWLAIIITAHGCFITPLTLMFVISSGNSMFFWTLVMAAMGMSLVTNLAALPTKFTIPVFFLGLVIDLVVIAGCISNGLTG